VEQNNFGIRKRLLEYDDVMNIQREAIYKKRYNALTGDRLAVDIHTMFMGLTESLVAIHRNGGDYESFRQDAMRLIGFDPKMDTATFADGREEEVVEEFQEKFLEFYARKSEKIAEVLLPVIKDVHENEGHRYKRIAVPFTDGSNKSLPISAGLEQAVNSNGSTIMQDIEKAVALSIIDDEWKEHLRAMDELKESTQAASFEQKDPLVVYKMEAYDLFEQLIYRINERVTSYLAKGTLVFRDGRTLEEAREQKTDLSRTRTNESSRSQADNDRQAAAASAGRGREKPQTFKRTEKKVGRNELCPCGSGKKYKHCHGK
jgi:preprotein translocase subunit SecA